MSTLLRAALIASALYSTPTRAASIRWGSPVVKKSPKSLGFQLPDVGSQNGAGNFTVEVKHQGPPGCIGIALFDHRHAGEFLTVDSHVVAAPDLGILNPQVVEGVDNRGADPLKITKAAGVAHDDVFKDDVAPVVVDGATAAGPAHELNLMFLHIIEVNLGVGVLVATNDDGRVVGLSMKKNDQPARDSEWVVVQDPPVRWLSDPLETGRLPR